MTTYKKRKIVAYFKGKRVEATFNSDATVTYRGYIYASPSGAGVQVMEDIGHDRGKNRVTCDGWVFWGTENRSGEFISLASLFPKRKKITAKLKKVAKKGRGRPEKKRGKQPKKPTAIKKKKEVKTIAPIRAVANSSISNAEKLAKIREMLRA